MAVEFACPYCETISSVPDAFAGKQGKCPSCAKVIEVPDPAAYDDEEAAPSDSPDRAGYTSGAAVGSRVGPGQGPTARSIAVPSPASGSATGDDTQDCRFCGEVIKRAAKKCRFCGEFIDPALRQQRRHGARGGGHNLASPWIRLAAVILDGLLLIPTYVVGFVGVAMTEGFQKSSPPGYAVIGLGVLLALGLIFFQWYLVATRGASLAKGWLGIKIVKDDGGPVGFVDGVVLRIWVLGFINNVLSQIPLVGCVALLISLVDALMIFAQDRKCLHDHIAKTVVIMAPRR